MTLNPKLRERLIQGVEAFVFAVLAGAVTAMADYFFEHPQLDSEGIHHLLDVAKGGAVGAALLYWKNKARLPEAHLPELGSKGSRHTDPPPPPPPVVAVAKAAVEAMKSQ